MAVPETSTRVSSLFTSDRRASLEIHKRRNVSATSELSTLPVASSVSDFLEEKVKACESQVDYLETFVAGLHEARDSKSVEAEDYKEQLRTTLNSHKPAVEELNFLKKQRRIIEEDLEDEADNLKRRKKDTGSSIDFLERAYTDTVVRKVMSASVKQKKENFKQSDFRETVHKYYASDDPDEGVYFCHVMGWLPAKLVKCAHLVPKSLSGRELAYIFGVEEDDVRYNPRNGIPLHENIEQGLDDGNIAIIPVPSLVNDEPTRWRCVLTNEALSNKPCFFLTRSYKWKEIDGRELTFLTDNRPARRYLYFRFIITYINSVKSGNTDFIKTVERRTKFWAPPGPYLRQSTLTTIARNISGVELPPSIYEENTFTSTSGKPSVQDNRTALMLASGMKEAVLASVSMRSRGAETEEDGEEENEE